VTPPALRSALQALRVLGVNAVPVLGLLLGRWDTATALVLYWCENALGSALVALRIAAHRDQTGASGHFRTHFGGSEHVRMTVTTGAGRRELRPRSLLAEFAALAGGFTAAHGLLLLLLLSAAGETLDRSSLRGGLVAVAGLQLAGFALDLRDLREWPFAAVKGLAQRSLGRVVLVHLAILGGFFLSIGRPRPDRIVAAFAALKTWSDLVALVPLRAAPPDPERPPAWAARLAALGPRGRQGFAAHWRETAERERRLAEEDERPSARRR
jgi:hypothetical protein